jgi:hypothetical protein
MVAGGPECRGRRADSAGGAAGGNNAEAEAEAETASVPVRGRFIAGIMLGCSLIQNDSPVAGPSGQHVQNQ